MKKKLTALIIMDGYGLSEGVYGNAINSFGQHNVDYLMKNYPSTAIHASGLAVGLPVGQMGNSEVGHLNIGAGRVVYQELTRITKSIADTDFFDNEAFLQAVENVKKTNGKLHLMGLISDGGVHSHINHLLALIDFAKQQGLADVYVHCFLDGRDVSPTSGAGFVKQLYEYTQKINFGKIASICGRYYAMDRDNRWDRVEKAYNMLALGEGEKSQCPFESILASYNKGTTDEFMLPTVVVDKNNNAVASINDGDSVIFFNFRPDRARELTRAFTQSNFNDFSTKDKKRKLVWVCLTQYDATFDNVLIAFKPQVLDNTLGQYLASKGLTQLRIAETEKYAHVTFFFNGGVELANDNETRVLINSPKVATYDLQPEMSAYLVKEKAIEEINSGKYDCMILNFANCDMVGHTGVFDATVKAVEAVDNCVKDVIDCILSNGGRAFVTADHGNAEQLFEENGSPFTAHTCNKVPLILVDEKLKNKVVLAEDGKLCDIAPSMLYLMGLEKPSNMTGENLVKLKD